MHFFRLLLVGVALSRVSLMASESIAKAAGEVGQTGEKQTGFVQLSNDHSGNDNQGFHDSLKMILTFLLSAVACLLVVLVVQAFLNLSKEYRYELVKLRKNYRNLQRANQLPLVSA